MARRGSRQRCRANERSIIRELFTAFARPDLKRIREDMDCLMRRSQQEGGKEEMSSCRSFDGVGVGEAT